MKTVTNSRISYISVSFSSLKVAMVFGVSPACSVRQSVDMDGAASCLSWTVAVYLFRKSIRERYNIPVRLDDQ